MQTREQSFIKLLFPFSFADQTFRAHVRETMLHFSARGHFAQVMQRERHHRCYLRWQETLQVDRIYADVSHEIRDIGEYLRLQIAERQRLELEAQAQEARLREQAAKDRAEKLQHRVSILAFIVGMPSLVLTFFGVNIQGWTLNGMSMVELLGMSLGVSAGLVAVAILVLWIVNKISERGSP